jgi:two-component system NtrC family sensor kinase
MKTTQVKQRVAGKLEEELNLKAQLLDAATDSIFLYRTDGSLVYVNEAAYKSRGYAKEELMAMNGWDLAIPELAHLFNSHVKEIIDEGEATFESVHRRKDGTSMLVETHSRAIKVNSEDLILSVCRDVTKRKQAEELATTLIHSSQVGVYLVQDGMFEIINPQIMAILGLTEEELLGRNALSLVHPEDREMVRDNAIKMLKGKRLEPYEFRVCDKKGNIRVVMETVAPVTYKGKRAALGNFMDITERKQAEEALRESQEQLRKMFESVTDGISVIDLDGVITEVNQRMVEIHEFGSKDELVGKNAMELVVPREYERIAANMKQAIKQGKVSGVEYTLLKANGTEFPAELSTSVLNNATGEAVGHITIVRDITERKGMQEQLMLTDRLASIGELASGIAHELNNPLTSVIGFSQLLMERDIADDFKEDLKLVHSEAQRAAGIVKNLLTFARKHAPVKQLTQINSVIEDVLRLRAYEQKVNNIEVSKKFITDLPEVMVDHFLIRQVFLNLVINAEYFMAAEHNKGVLTITTESTGNTVRVLIADDGPGISKENLNRIFNPFFTTKEVGKGTGLGLSICHGIVAEHGGSLHARSQLGKGATFVVELPIDGAGPKGGGDHGTS